MKDEELDLKNMGTQRTIGFIIGGISIFLTTYLMFIELYILVPAVIIIGISGFNKQIYWDTKSYMFKHFKE